MTFRVVIEKEAEREFAGAVDFYDGREPGLGQRFARDVRDVFRDACKNPERFPRVSRLTRKAKVLDWPYSVYFAIKMETAELVISTIWHGKRNPAELRRRLK
jgi:plasmid stabilization system protein ParE